MTDTATPNAADPWSLWLDWTRAMLDHEALAPQQLWQSILPGWIFAQTVNVNPQNSSAPDTERAILARESYGRQLGKVIDALDVLIRAQSSDITDADRVILNELHVLHDRISSIKDETANDRISRIRRDLRALEVTDSEAFGRLMDDLPAKRRSGR